MFCAISLKDKYGYAFADDVTHTIVGFRGGNGFGLRLNSI